jgi:hypothetical protein
MKKIPVIFALFCIPGFSFAEQLKTVYNPFTGKNDYITRLDATTIVAGAGISVSCVNGICTITNTGGGGTTFVLMEDGTDVLAEDGSKVLTEN